MKIKRKTDRKGKAKMEQNYHVQKIRKKKRKLKRKFKEK